MRSGLWWAIVAMGCEVTLGGGSGPADETDGSTGGPGGSTLEVPSMTRGESTSDGADGDTAADASPDLKLDVTLPPECASAADCALVDTCCLCGARPQSDAEPSCPLQCAVPICTALAVTNVACREVGGRLRCVASRNCDAADVVCDAPPPECPEDALPTVVDGCWDECLPATGCGDVGRCEDCPADHVCLLAGTGLKCVVPLPGCALEAPTCESCVPSDACEGDSFVCVDEGGGMECVVLPDPPP